MYNKIFISIKEFLLLNYYFFLLSFFFSLVSLLVFTTDETWEQNEEENRIKVTFFSLTLFQFGITTKERRYFELTFLDFISRSKKETMKEKKCVYC